VSEADQVWVVFLPEQRKWLGGSPACQQVEHVQMARTFSGRGYARQALNHYKQHFGDPGPAKIEAWTRWWDYLQDEDA